MSPRCTKLKVAGKCLLVRVSLARHLRKRTERLEGITRPIHTQWDGRILHGKKGKPMALDYAHGRTRIDEVELHGVRSLKSGRFTVTALTIDGQLLMPTREFWEDLFARYQLTSGWAERKSYARRFQWLAAHHAGDEIPYRVVWDENGNAWVTPSRRRKIRRACVQPSNGAATPVPVGQPLRSAAACSSGSSPASKSDVSATQGRTPSTPEWLVTRRRRIRQARVRATRAATRTSRLTHLFGGDRS